MLKPLSQSNILIAGPRRNVQIDTGSQEKPKIFANIEKRPISTVAAAPPTKKYLIRRISGSYILKYNKLPLPHHANLSSYPLGMCGHSKKYLLHIFDNLIWILSP